MARTLDNPLYYLDNFSCALDWIGSRYADLFDDEEQQFLAGFSELPLPSRALLVRMVMRKGPLFRRSKLVYPEIGDIACAAEPLLARGWVNDCVQIDITQLFGLLVKAEIGTAFGGAGQGLRKADQLALLAPQWPQLRRFEEWLPGTDDSLYALRVGDLCDRLRLMYFGNLYQDWSEFVLAELGIMRYEQVDISPASRGFGSREDIALYLRLHECRAQLDQGMPPLALLDRMPQQPLDNPWLEGRRQKLLFQLGQQLEREGAAAEAIAVYAGCRHAGARARRVRVLEKSGAHGEAHALASSAWQQPENEAERQLLARMLPRLRRRLGLAPLVDVTARPRAIDEFTLTLAQPQDGYCVERAVRDHLTSPDAPLHYVENTLINSLFGLLCWQALFAAVPGAFFHPFHSGPADLHSADFLQRRSDAFDHCLGLLDSDAWIETVLRNYQEKSGLQSPFVHWDMLDRTLLEQALHCLPPAHLKLWFRRLLEDIRANRAGMPDLIRFDLAARDYQMMEVKGPGDRLQDNQLRWIAFCARHGMPVRVCHVRWTDAA